MTTRPRSAPVPRSAFAGFRFPSDVIVVAVRWYLRYGLSYRDVEELLTERGVQVDHVTVYRKLPPDQREVLLLRMAAGLTAPEVAAALHKTTGAVKALQHRGLASLAVVLGLRGSDLDDAAARLRAWLRRPQPPHHVDPTAGHQEGQARRPN